MTVFAAITSFRELSLWGSADALLQLGDALEQALPAAWCRNREREKELSEKMPQGRYIAFDFEGSAGPAATVFLLVKTGEEDTKEATLVNIAPPRYGQLSIEQYNAIAEEFFTFLKPVAYRLELTATLTASKIPITDWLGERATEKLYAFSVGANKQGLHPPDMQRFIAFIIEAHRSGVRISAENLSRWLIEAEHWPEKRAHELSEQYLFGRDLLAAHSKTT